MIRFFSPALPAMALCFFTLTACGPTGKQLMGDPQNPYPLPSPPVIGQIVHLPTGIVVSTEQMFTLAGEARIVYFGETHDNPASHRLELQVLRALAELHPGRQALGMEMFARAQQPVLDRWVAGELNEKAFLKESRWFENWGMDFGYYRDLLNFARERRIPIVALNAEKDLVGAIRGKPHDQLSAEEQARLPKLDLNDPYQRGLVAAIFSDHSHKGMQLDGFIRVQTLWDETMAESAVRYLESDSGKGMHLLIIAGGNHVSHGFGIPRRVFHRLPVSYLLIGGREIDIPADKQNRLMNVTLPEFPMVPYDFLAYLAYEDLPKTSVNLGVTIEPTPAGHGLVVKTVAPGSNAERAGVQPADLLLAFDGEELTDPFDLVYAVKQKRQSSHGTLQIRRQGKTLTVDVLFRETGDGHPRKKP
jgi:uncharacterized iron-regulated protein